jgi:stage II sporulation protein R
MKKMTVATVCVLIVFLILGLLPTHGEAELYDKVVRLHVLARSDSEQDQALKLKVRDAVLAYCAEALSDCETREDAEKRLSGMIDTLTEIADKTVKDEGFDYAASVTLGKEQYPRRQYDGLCFPRGEYLSLRVILGEGEGQNWWCVLFPTLCLGSASAKEQKETFISAGFTAGQYKIITENTGVNYKIKFKCLEWLQDLRG